MREALTLRPATQQDRPSLAATFPDDAPWDAWLAEPDGQTTLALGGDALVGALHAVLLAPGEGWLETPRVVADWQERGVATLLLRHAQDGLHALGAVTLRADALDGDEPATNALRAAGFEPVGTSLGFAAASAGAVADPRAGPTIVQPGPADLERLWVWLERSSVLPSTGGVLFSGQRAVALTDDRLSAALAAGHVWTVADWDEVQALLIVAPAADRLEIRALDGQADAVGRLALALRAWAAEQHLALVTARPPDLLILHDALNGAGFAPLETRPRWLYAKEIA